MSTSIRQHAHEKSTRIIVIAFTDEDGVAVIPNDITWTLSDDQGTVINSHLDEIVVPASTINIVLTGDDLAILSSEDNGKRCILIEALYDSTYGSDLTLKDEVWFTIANLLNVT
jgi:hypothetical protein